jgi:hypothetical protein
MYVGGKRWKEKEGWAMEGVRGRRGGRRRDEEYEEEGEAGGYGGQSARGVVDWQ